MYTGFQTNLDDPFSECFCTLVLLCSGSGASFALADLGRVAKGIVVWPPRSRMGQGVDLRVRRVVYVSANGLGEQPISSLLNLESSREAIFKRIFKINFLGK